MVVIFKIILATVAALILFLGSVALRARIQSREGPGDLVVRWEGFVNDRNARDLGKSLNECLGKQVFKEELVFRSAQWFSGWSCDSIGNPDMILSLNYKPHKNEKYYCRKGDDNIIGLMSGGPKELNNIEYIDTWNDPVLRSSACWYFEKGISTLAADQRLLVHCDAGRDRTGTYSAVLAGIALELIGPIDAAGLSAIECDYRKSPSLVAEKYGRMNNFIKELTARGGVKQFLVKTCNIPAKKIETAAHNFLQSPSRKLNYDVHARQQMRL